MIKRVGFSKLNNTFVRIYSKTKPMVKLEINPNAPRIYSETFSICSFHTDVHRKLTVPKLCSFFQEIAGNHTEACGVGWNVLQHYSIFWGLIRLKIEITQMPYWHENIEIKTWSNGFVGLQAVRQFQVLDSNGKEMARAASSWVMMNPQTRRVVRPDEYMNDFPTCSDRLFDKDPDKLPSPSEALSFAEMPVSYTETDMNAHMNNVSYIDRVLNSFDYKFLESHRISQFEINFLKEARPGELVGVCRQETQPLTFLSSLKNSETASEFVRTSMVFKPL